MNMRLLNFKHTGNSFVSTIFGYQPLFVVFNFDSCMNLAIYTFLSKNTYVKKKQSHIFSSQVLHELNKQVVMRKMYLI